MKLPFFSLVLAFCGLALMSFLSVKKKPITVYLVGDSTMSIKDPKAYPETGWGVPFATFFDPSVAIDNHAKNGRSTKTFLTEKRWQTVEGALKKGDYVFIQFGHNDEVKTKASYATEEEFTQNLTRFVTEARKKKAIPILITPAARRKFDANGKIEPTHEAYSALVREVAKKEKVCLIDLDKKSQELLQSYGPEDSKKLFLHLQPGQHPNYPEGKADDTHFNERGALEMAQIVLAEVKALKLDLAKRITAPAVTP
ncbi:GntR family transcriptional regulator [Rufibacter radiotolerans]|uniref:GntR family transcriptional regulator n=1 Tax=Rufibacter radiotolerans TaxID=1379910 RepID=A0A0H4VNJ9_9BACT|nr:rhamnogalacturonan acetylesterase [Rufibacter radiotolerans]AKQ47490.1 GntR family transcriptional regulator [Rufibacter radiotolerans]